jgi:hypothetical protein
MKQIAPYSYASKVGHGHWIPDRKITLSRALIALQSRLDSICCTLSFLGLRGSEYARSAANPGGIPLVALVRGRLERRQSRPGSRLKAPATTRTGGRPWQ